MNAFCVLHSTVPQPRHEITHSRGHQGPGAIYKSYYCQGFIIQISQPSLCHWMITTIRHHYTMNIQILSNLHHNVTNQHRRYLIHILKKEERPQNALTNLLHSRIGNFPSLSGSDLQHHLPNIIGLSCRAIPLDKS